MSMANAIWTRDNVKVEVGDWVVMGEDDDREAGRVVEIEGGKAAEALAAEMGVEVAS